MKYSLIHKDRNKQPATGIYSDWKVQIASECNNQCIYCTINENQWGGIDHYHIEHYRPKSIPRFKHLENDICNLFYACPVCNRFKSDDWPAEPDLNVISYPDPSITNYDSIFDFNQATYTLVGLYTSSKYMIERLYLNRPQLIYERRETDLKSKEVGLFNEISQLAVQTDDKELMKKAFTILTTIRNHLQAREKIRPYKLAEIRKP